MMTAQKPRLIHKTSVLGVWDKIFVLNTIPPFPPLLLDIKYKVDEKKELR